MVCFSASISYHRIWKQNLKEEVKINHAGSRLLYLDIKTGEKLFEETNNIFGTWLGYSSEYKLLLQATQTIKRYADRGRVEKG